MNEKHKAAKVPLTFEFQAGDNIDRNSVQRKNLGYAAFSQIYHELGIHQFMVNRQRNLKIDYQLNDVLKLLVFQRILKPASKLKTFEGKDRYYEKYDFTLADVYRSLSRFPLPSLCFPFLKGHRIRFYLPEQIGVQAQCCFLRHQGSYYE